MKRAGSITFAVCLLCAMFVGSGSAGGEYAAMSINAGEIVWHPLVDNGGVTLSVTGPHGAYIREELSSGSSPMIGLTDSAGAALPDGQYSYEIVLAPAAGTMTRPDNDAAAARATEPMIQSGSFRVVTGRFFIPSSSAESTGITAQAIPDGGIVPLDQVIPDDLIVQGSLCVGFDCVNGESFGFDTIRLKENNTRIKFEDTSVGTFPTNDWTIVANDSASGGASYLAFEDTTGAKTPFKVTAGAPTNSLFVDSSGNVGLGTATPVLDLHINMGDTPAVRLEQNASSGWTAQTWDIAGNESNFFVRDTTGGSKLPFRIRPGAPTSSIDINASGNVGIGTSSPAARLSVSDQATSANRGILVSQYTSDIAAASVMLRKSRGTEGSPTAVTNGDYVGSFQFKSYDGTSYLRNAMIGTRVNGATAAGSVPSDIFFSTSATDDSDPYTNGKVRMVITSAGRVGIGNVSPAYPLQVGTNGTNGNGAYVTVGGVWTNGSSREFKDNIKTLTTAQAFDAVNNLVPVTYSYKADMSEKHVGFIAEDVPDLVATPDRKHLSPMDIVAVLTKVVQEQNRTIEELKAELLSLRTTVSRISTK